MGLAVFYNISVILDIVFFVCLPSAVFGGGNHYCETAAKNPCQNGATCVGLTSGGYHNNDYRCDCLNGWTGRQCESIDCQSSLYCVNGGTCHASGAQYSCTCANGYMGSNCESIDCNSPVWCLHGGTCSVVNGAASCDCSIGWHGNNCQLVDCSSPVWCINGGTCSTSNGGTVKQCDCYYGWMNHNCQDIDVCTPHVEADIVFVLDVSLNMKNETFAAQKDFVKTFTSKFRVGPLNYRYQFALVTYSFDAVIHFQLADYQNDTDLQIAIDNVTHDIDGPTLTGRALQLVREQVLLQGRSSVAQYVIVLTDGLSSNPVNTRTQAAKLHADGVNVLAVGIGSTVRHKELLDITDKPRHVFSIHNTDALHAVLENSMTGCKDCHGKVSDIAIAMDISANINHLQLNTQMQAAEELMGITAVGPNDQQFSFVTFSDQIKEIFDFDQHSTFPAMMADMNMYTKRDTTNSYADASSVFHYYKHHGFDVAKGARPSTRKLLVVFTSGQFTNTQSIQQDVQDIKDTGVTVVTVGVGRNVNMTSLLHIASDPSLTYVVGADVFNNVTVLRSLWTTMEYDICTHI